MNSPPSPGGTSETEVLPLDHGAFLRAFIASYKDNSVLWDTSHPYYRSKPDRLVALNMLIATTRRYIPEADEEFVRSKIDSMRASYRRERSRMKQRMSKNPGHEDKPTLWYFNLLRFLDIQSEEGAEERKREQVTSTESRLYFWNRERSAILINLYKSCPCLYSPSHPWFGMQSKRSEALKGLAEKMKMAVGQEITATEIRKKITSFRRQFFEEYGRLKHQERNGDPKTMSWNFELLSFLKNDVDGLDGNEMSEENFISDDFDNERCVKNEYVAPQLSYREESQDDIYDTVGKNLAFKLRQMDPNQREIADRLIREVMYFGLMEQLSQNSRLSLNGT